MLKAGVVALVACWPLSGLGAQEDMLRQRLDPQTYAALQPVLEAARRDSLPVQALEAKALEGAAKRVPSVRLVGAVGTLADALREARELLRAGAPGAALRDGEIVAAAEARGRGVPADDLTALRRSAPPATPLEIPFALLGDLLQRGVPAGHAFDVIVHLVASGIPQERMVEIPQRVDVGLRVGALPVAALGSALQSLGIPSPPLTPRRPPVPRVPNG